MHLNHELGDGSYSLSGTSCPLGIVVRWMDGGMGWEEFGSLDLGYGFTTINDLYDGACCKLGGFWQLDFICFIHNR